MTMAQTITQDELAQAVLQAVHGFYPDSDSLASAELTPEVLPTILSQLENAIQETKAEVRTVAKQHKNEVDMWRNDARELHTDIAQNKEISTEILRLEREGVELQAKAKDAEIQHELLASEIEFNQELFEILMNLQLIQATFNQAQEHASSGKLSSASQHIALADKELETMKGDQVLAVELLKETSKGLKESLIETVEECWQLLIQVKPENGSVTILKQIEMAHGSMAGETIVEALEGMQILKARLDKLYLQLDDVLFSPRLKDCTKKGEVVSFALDKDQSTLRVEGWSKDLSAGNLYKDLRFILEFLSQRLGPAISQLLSRTLTPSLITKLLSDYLPSCIPTSLDLLPIFEDVLKETCTFEDWLELHGWTTAGERDLRDWVDRAPKIWLSKRREGALDKLRHVFTNGISSDRTVERTETMVEKNGHLVEVPEVVHEHAADVWDSKWKSDDESKPEPETAAKSISTKPPLTTDEEEDVSGWGLDDDLNLDEEEEKTSDPLSEPQMVSATTSSIGEKAADMDVDWDAWGDEDGEITKLETAAAASGIRSRRNSTAASSAGGKGRKNDITLKETYKITNIPDEIMQIIMQTLDEAQGLGSERYSSSAVAPASISMLGIPTQVLAGYRALSTLFYIGTTASPMALYNDCVWLEEQLSSLTRGAHTGVLSKLDLSAECKAISAYGKRAYSKEMDVHRLIIADLMDGAQGFQSCTDFPLSTECENAVSAVVAHIRSCNDVWKDALSHSALLQSLGSLLTTVVTKFINDVEDLSDISADESTKLASFCTEIGTLEVLFHRVGHVEGQEALPLTPIYCEKWLKFQYLSQILVCTMVDLMYLYRERALVDFEKEELIELVMALFAEGEKRQKVIAELRHG